MSSNVEPTPGMYGATSYIDVATTYSEPVTVTGIPRMALIIGSQTRYATFGLNADASSLIFRYSIQSDDSDLDGIELGTIELDGGTIIDAAGNAATAYTGFGRDSAARHGGAPHSATQRPWRFPVPTRLGQASSSTRASRRLGAAGNDKLAGGPGNDHMNGGTGRDQVWGGLGNDVIFAWDDERDIINCGPGKDTVCTDRVDVVRKNCERVRRVEKASLR